jgi:hypothetical protein
MNISSPENSPLFRHSGRSITQHPVVGEIVADRYSPIKKIPPELWIESASKYLDKLGRNAPRLPKLELLSSTVTPRTDLLDIVFETDLHLNMLSPDKSYGFNAGLSRCKATFLAALERLPRSHTLEIIINGDLGHVDDAFFPAQTRAHGNPLRTDVDYDEMLEGTISTLYELVIHASRYWPQTNLRFVCGNHDNYSYLYAVRACLFQMLGRNGDGGSRNSNSRIYVDKVLPDWLILPWKKCLILANHGTKCGNFARQRNFASSLPEFYGGNCNFCLIVTGHRHEEKSEQKGITKCLQLPAQTPSVDDYSRACGFPLGQDSLIALVLHESGYEFGRFTIPGNIGDTVGHRHHQKSAKSSVVKNR